MNNIFFFFNFLVTEKSDKENLDDDVEEIEAKKRKMEEDEEIEKSKEEEREEENNSPVGIQGGILVYHKTRKAIKKSVRWQTDKDLEMIKYFELDETERGKYITYIFFYKY